jgi:hypothetical protein
MMVLHAVSLAGGTSQMTVGGQSSVLSANSELARLQQAKNSLKRSLATMARLRAERAGKGKIKRPKALVRLVGKKETARLIADQMEILRNSNKSFDRRNKAVRQAIKIANGELKAMNQQEQLLKRQIDLQQQQRSKLKGLKQRGLISDTRMLDRESMIAQAQEKSISALVARSRLRGRLLDLQRELLVVRQKKESALDQKILELQNDIAAQKITYETSRKAVRTLNVSRRAFSDSNSETKKTSFQIVRPLSGRTKTIIAERLTHLLPGDIVIVN